MRKVSFWLAVAMVVAIAGSGAIAATTMWLTDSSAGVQDADMTITAASGADITLYCYMNSSDAGNTFEAMVGYDESDATTYGAGKDTNDGEYGKLVLMNTAAIAGSIDPAFGVIRASAYAGKAVVLDASAREDNNTDIGGRPYGFSVREAKTTNTAPGQVRLFSFTLRNQMLTEGEHQYVVLSNKSEGNSFSDAWKYGTSLKEASYALKIVTGPVSSKPVVGASNKAVLASIMNSAAPNYIWVLWGKVSNLNATAGTFDIDDGSGVIIHVSASASEISSKGIANTNYVAVKGTLTLDPPTLTSQSITKYN